MQINSVELEREDSGEMNAEHVVSVTDRLQTLQEVFPALDAATLCDLLTSNDWDLTLSFEAALALSCITENSSGRSATEVAELQVNGIGEDGDGQGEDQMAQMLNASTKEEPLSAENTFFTVVEHINKNSSGEAPHPMEENKPDGVVPLVKVNRRGRHINLGSKFLAVPCVKVITSRRTDWCTEYTVIFRKVSKIIITPLFMSSTFKLYIIPQIDSSSIRDICQTNWV